MKIAVHMLLFNQDKFILKTLENCGEFVDKIYIGWSRVPWNYNATAQNIINKTNLNILKQSKYYDKIQVVIGEWKLDEDERNACRLKAKEDGMDYLIIQDCDEFYTREGYKNLINSIKNNPDYDYYNSEWIVFWKNLKYCVVGENWKRGQICGDVEVAINLNKDIEFVRARSPGRNGRRCGNFLKIQNATCYHLCFVLTDEECWNKINTWGHSHQFNINEWYKNVWLNWNPTMINIHPITPNAWHKTLEFKGPLPKELC
tara:strand:- start:606 stop:1382 length:777 start_codon:yes stop_codon:yes gene_type:complete